MRARPPRCCKRTREKMRERPEAYESIHMTGAAPLVRHLYVYRSGCCAAVCAHMSRLLRKLVVEVVL